METVIGANAGLANTGGAQPALVEVNGQPLGSLWSNEGQPRGAEDDGATHRYGMAPLTFVACPGTLEVCLGHRKCK